MDHFFEFLGNRLFLALLVGGLYRCDFEAVIGAPFRIFSFLSFLFLGVVNIFFSLSHGQTWRSCCWHRVLYEFSHDFCRENRHSERREDTNCTSSIFLLSNQLTAKLSRKGERKKQEYVSTILRLRSPHQPQSSKTQKKPGTQPIKSPPVDPGG